MFRMFYRVRTAAGELAPHVTVYDCKDDADYERALNTAVRENYEIIDIQYIPYTL